MATSFAFLDKPAKGLTTAAQGPQPKPQTSARGFLDLSNPWAVPGVTAGAPARPSASSGTTAKTPAKTTTKPKADIPTRGYNYTESSTASGQPAAVRQREVDQATMSGQAAGQRKAAAKAQPQPGFNPSLGLTILRTQSIVRNYVDTLEFQSLTRVDHPSDG